MLTAGCRCLRLISLPWHRSVLLMATLALFALTLFLSAALLFSVQPMTGRMILPLLGGSAAVWTTCLVFFQATLLAGYLYAHATTSRLGPRRQAALHAAVLLLPFFVLPISIRAASTASSPSPGLVVTRILLGSVALPLFLVSASAPLLQRWIAATSHPAAKDPYFLYAASNLGSLCGLIAYPSLIEPHLTLVMQARVWAFGYGLLVMSTLACAAVVWRSAPPIRTISVEKSPTGISCFQRARWIALAFVPSSLMVGVTTQITTELAAIPLLWTIPLGIYLISFIVAFAGMPAKALRIFAWLTPALILLTIFALRSGLLGLVSTMILDFVTLFAVGIVCHGQLSAGRPSTGHLTEFYLWLSVGGVLGGLLNALIAPMFFNSIVEFPLVLVLACLLLPSVERPAASLRVPLDVAAAATTGLLCYGLVWLAADSGLRFGSVAALTHASPNTIRTLLIFGVPSLFCYGFVRRPTRFALAMASFLVVTSFGLGTPPLYQTRDFFGVLTVRRLDYERSHVLIHGNTQHGKQFLDPARRSEPSIVYHRTGPIGDLMAAFNGTGARPLGIIGLGAGSLATYAAPGQKLTYYEIDPKVLEVAEDSRYFTFLKDAQARGVQVDVVLGDARLRLADARLDQKYGMLIVDAFSSDVIPLHLITREAVELYLDKLEPDGLLIFNVSNRHLSLPPVLGNIAAAENLAAVVKQDGADERIGRQASTWVAITRDPKVLVPLFQLPRGGSARGKWRLLSPSPRLEVWSDDFSDLLSVFKWAS